MSESGGGARATARARTTIILAAPLLKLSTRLLLTGRWSQAITFREGKKGLKIITDLPEGRSIRLLFSSVQSCFPSGNLKFVQDP